MLSPVHASQQDMGSTFQLCLPRGENTSHTSQHQSESRPGLAGASDVQCCTWPWHRNRDPECGTMMSNRTRKWHVCAPRRAYAMAQSLAGLAGLAFQRERERERESARERSCAAANGHQAPGSCCQEEKTLRFSPKFLASKRAWSALCRALPARARMLRRKL